MPEGRSGRVRAEEELIGAEGEDPARGGFEDRVARWRALVGEDEDAWRGMSALRAVRAPPV